MGQHKPRVYTIHDFLSWHRRDELVLQPRFQRLDAWKPEARSYLIDTLIRGLPAGIIFLRQTVNPQTLNTVREVVDGQQRLRAIFDFIEDGFPLREEHNDEFGGMCFSALPSKIQQQFVTFEFSVVVLENASDQTVLDIFARLNTYAEKLNRQELLNARYHGPFKQTVYSLAREHYEFWRENRILTDRRIMRMDDADLVSLLIATMLLGIHGRRQRVEELYREGEKRFPERSRIESAFRSVIDAIAAVFPDGLRSGIYRQKALFPSLFTAIYHVIYGVPETPELPKIDIRQREIRRSAQAIREALEELEAKYRAEPREEWVERFWLASKEGTNDRDTRILRAQTLVEVIGGAVGVEGDHGENAS